MFQIKGLWTNFELKKIRHDLNLKITQVGEF